MKTSSNLPFEVKLQAKGRSKILHHDRLKPYTSSQIPELQHTIKHQTRSSVGHIAAAANKAQPGAQPPDLDIDTCGVVNITSRAGLIRTRYHCITSVKVTT